MPEIQDIPLQPFFATGSRCLVGRNHGEDIARRTCIAAFAANRDTLNIIVPDDCFTLSPTFLEGLLAQLPGGMDAEGFAAQCRFNYQVYGTQISQPHTHDENTIRAQDLQAKAHEAYLRCHRAPVFP